MRDPVVGAVVEICQDGVVADFLDGEHIGADGVDDRRGWSGPYGDSSLVEPEFADPRSCGAHVVTGSTRSARSSVVEVARATDEVTFGPVRRRRPRRRSVVFEGGR